MKAATIVCVVLGVWICGAYCSEQAEENSVEFAPAEMYSSDVESAHHRVRRSPLDPIVAPLLIGKSFLYGALVGPKLFKPYIPHHRGYYHHYHLPIHHYPKFYGHGYGYGGYGGGHFGGYGYGR